MISIDPNSVVNSFERALVPNPDLVDGRDDKERLSFLANFASLINFYDKQNNISGSWKPFLLKDPVILVASISKSPFKQQYPLYVAGIEELAYVINQGVTPIMPIEVQINQEKLAMAFNQLFPLITRVYQQIEQWTEFMKNAPLNYTLKSYTLEQLEKKYGAIFWATLSLQEYLATQNVIQYIVPVDWDIYASYDQIIWKDSKDKRPFWEVLGLFPMDGKDGFKIFQEYVDAHIVDGKYDREFLNEIWVSLKYAGDQTYTFYKSMVDYAVIEYDEIIKKEDNYPDTLLVRTFVDLMNVYKDQANTLAEKHLNFYYDDILKQKKELASPDHVFASANLSFEDGTYILHKDIRFNAGENEKAETILFKSVKETSLNSGAIANVYTLSTNETDFYVREIENVGEKQVDENEMIQSWETFGSQQPQENATMSFLMASPMLFMGMATNRVLTITMTFSEDVEKNLFESVLYFLSTSEEWIEIQPSFLDTTPDKTKEIQFTINLDVSIPPITPFGEDVDEVQSEWPLLKMIFNEYGTLNSPPQIQKIQIDVDVIETLNASLYSDFGALSFEEPFQLFGPTPEKNQNFFIGSNEIFSKPVTKLDVKLNWDNLPPEGFCVYYDEYNAYLHPDVDEDCPETVVSNNIFGSIWGILKMIFDFIAKAIPWLDKIFQQKSKKEDQIIEPVEPVGPSTSWQTYFFNNTSFTIHFQQLTENQWKPFPYSFNTDILFKVEDGKNILTENQPTNTLIEMSLAVIGTIELTVPASINPLEKVTLEGNSIEITLPDATDKATITQNNEQVTINLTDEQNITVKLSDGVTDVIVSFDTDVINLIIPSLLELENLYDYSNYYCEDTKDENVIISNPNPILQMQNPLEFTETTTSGFMRIQLTSDYGFGAGLYPKVISSVALYNAGVIAQMVDGNPDNLEMKPQPNTPYIPLVGAFSLSYTASQVYDFEDGFLQNYPLEFYYSTPFSTYKAYDNTNGLYVNGTTLVNPPQEEPEGIPVYPQLASQGNLLIPLQNLIFPAELSLYFELTTDLPSALGENTLNYNYLSNDGWKTLPVVYDGTQNLNCSGIITFNLPDDMTQSFPTLPEEFYYISISIAEDATNYSRTSFLKTNGFELVRIGDNYLHDIIVPQILADTITEPEQAIPQIESVIQPFPSFGGKAMETPKHKDIRIATRLTTKDRLITEQDYYRSIQLSFLDIYFSKILYDKMTDETQVFLVKKVENCKDTNAFLPLVSACIEKEVLDYLVDRASGLVNLQVSNFEMKYVKVIADLSVNSGYSIGEVSKQIEDQLSVFMAPWIQTQQDQIEIDSGLTTAQIANFIKQNKAISEVNSIALQLGIKDVNNGTIYYECLTVQEIEVATNEGQLLYLDGLCIIIDLVISFLEDIFYSETETDPVSISLEDLERELSQEFQRRLGIPEESIAEISTVIIHQAISWIDESFDAAIIRALLEELFESLGLSNTAYINKKTLLVPSLDYSSLTFGSA